MKEFFSYFFGAGTEIEFTNFGFAHFAPILVAIGIIFAIFKSSFLKISIYKIISLCLY